MKVQIYLTGSNEPAIELEGDQVKEVGDKIVITKEESHPDRTYPQTIDVALLPIPIIREVRLIP